MAKKDELIADLQREVAELDALYAEAGVTVEQLLAACAAHKAQVALLQAQLAAQPQPQAAKPPRPARVVPPDELARVAAMARAKAAAAASRKTVAVELGS